MPIYYIKITTKYEYSYRINFKKMVPKPNDNYTNRQLVKYSNPTHTSHLKSKRTEQYNTNHTSHLLTSNFHMYLKIYIFFTYSNLFILQYPPLTGPWSWSRDNYKHIIWDFYLYNKTLNTNLPNVELLKKGRDRQKTQPQHLINAANKTNKIQTRLC